MRESMVCIGQIGEEPYCFQETGVCVFSYEEMVYYLSEHMICYLYTLPDEELLYYIRDQLGLEKLSRQLSRFRDPAKDQMKYFSTLFREGNYFTEDEIRQILDEYRKLKNMPYPVQCKWKGDMFLNANRASMAIYYYKEALRQNTMDSAETGAVYHNMGIAKARLFRYHDADVDFVKAYQYAGDEESLFCYYCINVFVEGLAQAKEELRSFKVSDLLLESFENRFDAMNDEFGFSGLAASHKKIDYLMLNGREEDGMNARKKLVRELQKEFRQELETEDNLYSTNLPAKNVFPI
ncbi:MAG: hypothetical protein LUF92_08550 [Clostridiales bacterium]|nr:hypothetical protein [Clostridiales bacterium]